MNHPLLPRHDQQCHIRSPVPSPPLPPIPLPEEDHVTLSSPHHDISKQAFSRIALPGSPPLPRRRSPGSKPVRRSAPQPAMASQRFNRGRTNGDGVSCQCCLLVGNSALPHSASRSFFVFAVRLARGLAVALSRLAGLVGGGGMVLGGFLRLHFLSWIFVIIRQLRPFSLHRSTFCSQSCPVLSNPVQPHQSSAPIRFSGDSDIQLRL
ncbi:uncharacterized protein BKA78DRAFT_154792 [Phyllosticta capitalensis]|uniref:uncharacterized protein n=1 Tax=Phyllosticta capitalensis TaxID=121624 RepID=UPI00312F5FBD